MPRPSSATVTTTSEPSCMAWTLTVPWAGLPAARRVSGGSMPWSMALRTRWRRGSATCSRTPAVELGLLAAQVQLDRLAERAGQVADGPAQRLGDGAEGDHAGLEAPLLEALQGPGELDELGTPAGSAP